MKKIVRMSKQVGDLSQFDISEWGLPDFEEKVNLAKQAASEALEYAFANEIETFVNCGWDSKTKTYKGKDIEIMLMMDCFNLELGFYLGEVLDKYMDYVDTKAELQFIRDKLQQNLDKIDTAIKNFTDE